eukprot:Tamp_17909.p1 GENE.Tamp_17909~~Tamp_17909.p1  ORF type:complete len:302 (+),score=64.55 Tamp_17909:46-906(+)
MEGWGRGGWAMRNGRTEGDGFLDCVRLVALLVGSWAVGVAIRAMQEETIKAYRGSVRPWLYEGIRRTDQYAHWQFPPLLELWRFVRKSLQSAEKQRAMLQRAIVQMRVLTQIRGGARETVEVRYTWALHLDEDIAVRENKQIVRNLQKISRKIAEQKREFETKTGLLEARIERLSETMMDGLDILFETDFMHSDLVWPRAEIGFAAVEKAVKTIEAEIEADKKVVLKIPMKRLITMDKQLSMADKLIENLRLYAKQEERLAAETAQAQESMTMSLADRNAIYFKTL